MTATANQPEPGRPDDEGEAEPEAGPPEVTEPRTPMRRDPAEGAPMPDRRDDADQVPDPA